MDEIETDNYGLRTSDIYSNDVHQKIILKRIFL